jgi:Gas vesicle synthesis protein GvpL/GvpF
MMARGAVLPLRFGTQLLSEEQLAAALAQRGEELSQALDHVRGRVEVGLRVIPEDIKEKSSRASAFSGREMLLARVQEQQRTMRVARQLHAPLAGLAAASTVHDHPRPPAILVASYLVDDEQVAAFRGQADQLAAGQDAMRVLVTGPWPPYSFATAEQR